MSDYKALGGVSRSREDLNRVVHDAEKRLEGMEKEMAELQKQLKEQQDIVSRAEELRNAYNRESLKWERSVNLSLPPGSTYPIKRHVGEYTKGRGYTVQRHYPWLWTLPPPPPPPPAPAPAPAPAPRPKKEDRGKQRRRLERGGEGRGGRDGGALVGGARSRLARQSHRTGLVCRRGVSKLQRVYSLNTHTH